MEGRELALRVEGLVRPRTPCVLCQCLERLALGTGSLPSEQVELRGCEVQLVLSTVQEGGVAVVQAYPVHLVKRLVAGAGPITALDHGQGDARDDQDREREQPGPGPGR